MAQEEQLHAAPSYGDNKPVGCHISANAVGKQHQQMAFPLHNSKTKRYHAQGFETSQDGV